MSRGAKTFAAARIAAALIALTSLAGCNLDIQINSGVGLHQRVQLHKGLRNRRGAEPEAYSLHRSSDRVSRNPYYRTGSRHPP